jgi:dihydroorotase
LRPHHDCLPVLKRERDRRALLDAATSGDPHFFLGSDSAPHARSEKESACGCAGIYSAPIALELYAEAFASVGALDRLEGFASRFGADFYRLPRNRETRKLESTRWTVPAADPQSDDEPVLYWAGRSLDHRLV